jgi:predicted HD phosphohydrolase
MAHDDLGAPPQAEGEAPVSEVRARFTAMTESTAEDWAIIAKEFGAFRQGHADRVLGHLKALADDHGGFPVDRLEHSLQTATHAFQDGRDEEYVVCALLHDIGDTLGAANHADIAAAIIKPYVSPENHWMVEHHAIFQGYYYFDFLGLDRNLREQFRGHPMFEETARFCHAYDQNAFDPAFKSMPLEAFEPMVQRVFAKVKTSLFFKPN